ncbi:MAG TPA: hypothetical protein PLL53_05010 [Saprospiraceae bacterium]|nr:hypothetical protein [Saprospiraceae bacterium]
MRQPITVPSNVEFLIVGPTIKDDGILIQSIETEIDLVGFAYRLYQIGDNPLTSKEIINLQKEIHSHYLWSPTLNMKSYSRGFKLLFVWRVKEYTRVLSNEQKSSIEKEFGNFLENTNSVIDYMLTTISRGKEIRERFESVVHWKISSLLLECYLPVIKLSGKIPPIL